jgi:ABC-type polysaccharide/polyol phosphate export permease
VIASVGFARLTDKFDLPEKLINLFPSVVCMRQSSFSADPDFWPALIAMIAETAIIFMIGNLYFRKTDIN